MSASRLLTDGPPKSQRKPLNRSLYAAKAARPDHVIDEDGDGAADIADVMVFLKHNKAARRALKADDKYPGGDFRIAERNALLDEVDIVVTDPTLFMEASRCVL